MCMKIMIYRDSGMHTVASPTDHDDERTIDVTDQEWTEFKDTEDHYGELLRRFEAQLDTKRQEAESELDQLRVRLMQLEARLGSKPALTAASIPSIPAARKPHNPVDETDWGMGVGGREKPMAAGDFREELASLKDRTTEKRQKRGSA